VPRVGEQPAKTARPPVVYAKKLRRDGLFILLTSNAWYSSYCQWDAIFAQGNRLNGLGIPARAEV
jgi:hypothetical protein